MPLTVKNSPAMQETWVGEGNGTYSSTLAGEIPWTEEPEGLQFMGFKRIEHN